ncbi:hypothetical protein [Paraconexibacter sp.]|uniref:hypothetical protein n=1 Tax=Paraconexibacter sp. TaxID=2949640 RepID=UPI0035676C0D
MQNFRPSPALVVSIVALVVACAGTATAASVLITSSSQVKAGSLNGSDIKNSSLTGLDIKNKSLRGGDLSDNTVTGRQIRADTITAEDLAPAVRNTLRGEGLTATEAVRRSGPEARPANVPATIGKLDLQPGTYLVLAKSTITADTTNFGLGELLRANKTGSAECVLEMAGEQDHARQAVITPGSVAPATLNMQFTRTVDAAAPVTLSCSVNDFQWRASDTSITAVKLSGTTRVDTTG